MENTIMTDEEFYNEMNDIIPDFEDLTEDEILNRQKEFLNLSEEGKNILRDISGIQNSRIITLNALMCNSMLVIKDADDDIEDIEFSEEYLKFLTWYDQILRSGTFYPRYANNEKIFEDILNRGLENEDENNIFAYFKKKYIEKVRGVITKEIDEPLTGVEVEACSRFEAISNSNKNLINIFENIEKYKDYTWEEFVNIL